VRVSAVESVGSFVLPYLFSSRVLAFTVEIMVLNCNLQGFRVDLLSQPSVVSD
jgi:hypothetical protein